MWVAWNAKQSIEHLFRGENSGRSAIDIVLDVDIERRELMAEVESLEKTEHRSAAQAMRMTDAYARLEEIDAAK
jgi:hypothetical protein